MQLFNLRKEFERLKMKETENVKAYIDRIINVVNQIRLMSKELPEKNDHREGNGDSTREV